MIKSCLDPQINIKIPLFRLYAASVTVEKLSLFSSDLISITYGIANALKDSDAFKRLNRQLFDYEFRKFVLDNTTITIRFLRSVDESEFQGSFCELKGQYYYIKLLIENNKLTVIYNTANIDPGSFCNNFTIDYDQICNLLAK